MDDKEDVEGCEEDTDSFPDEMSVAMMGLAESEHLGRTPESGRASCSSA
jgi:hypothetical protein